MAVSVKQSKSSASYASASITTTLSSATVQNNTIVALVYNHINNTALTSMKDGAGNNLDLLGSVGTASSREIYMYAMPAQASQNLSFTATLSTATLGMDVFELSGALIGTLGTPASYYISLATTQPAAQAAPGDYNATPVAPSVTTQTTGDLILTGLTVATNMGTPTSPTIGDTSGTGTYTFGYMNPTASVFSFSGYETAPSVGTHIPYLTATGGTARATSVITAVFKAQATGTNQFFGMF